MNSLNDEQLNRLYDRIEQLVNENEKLKEGKHAHWIEYEEDHVSCDSAYYYTCSECKHSFSDDTPYCPHCGAKMDEEMENK